MKALIIEDDIEIQNLLKYFFTKNGFEVEVSSNGLEGLKALKKFNPNIIILDLMLPALDGKNFTKIVREMPEEYGNPPIIMLTAKTEIEDVLEGLNLGANDYIKKPFDPREVVIRAKKLCESNSDQIISNVNTPNSSIHKLEELEVDERKRQVLFKKREIDLSKKEYDLLLLFLNNKGLVLTREKILDYVWGTDYFSGDRSVDVYISKLREKIPTLSQYIKTLKGVGYKLEERKE
ncbi:MAG: response regulator transcription factor [Fusobacteriaceae bacterium]